MIFTLSRLGALRGVRDANLHLGLLGAISTALAKRIRAFLYSSASLVKNSNSAAGPGLASRTAVLETFTPSQSLRPAVRIQIGLYSHFGFEPR